MPTGIYKHKPHTKETKRKIGENSAKFWLGKKKSPEHQKRINESLRGNKFALGHKYKCSEETKKKISKALKGRIKSQETRKRLSESHKGIKSYNWKGGITSKNKEIRNGIEFRLWREAVFARDNWTCQKYGIRGQKDVHLDLHPHHIKNFAEYPELRFTIDNGITLSMKAHKEFHKKFGWKNNTKEQLNKFLTINI